MFQILICFFTDDKKQNRNKVYYLSPLFQDTVTCNRPSRLQSLQ